MLIVAVVAIGLLTPSGRADGEEGLYRIQLTSGRWIEGEVKQLSNGSYEIKTRHGAIMTLPKYQIRKMEPLDGGVVESEEAEPNSTDEGDDFRRPIKDEEVDRLLSGITVGLDESLRGCTYEEMMEPLPASEKAAEQMLAFAGEKAELMEKDHFVFVYTTSRDKALDLASRLESVWRWNARFMQLMELPPRRPEHKLEVYYFATQAEFFALRREYGASAEIGVLGTYFPDKNRSAFFDLETFTPVEVLLERAENPDMPYDNRQYLHNAAMRWVEFNNREVVQHETGHHIHFNTGVFPADTSHNEISWDSVPRWLVEGTTMLFEVPPTSEGASLGAINHGRLKEFREMYVNPPLNAYQMEAFIVDNRIFLAGGGNTYCLGWALVNYCWKKNREGLRQYMRIISKREPGFAIDYTQREKEFEDAFGEINDKWVEDFYKYVAELKLAESVLPPDLGALLRGESPGRGGNVGGDRSGGGRRDGGGRGGRGRRGGRRG